MKRKVLTFEFLPFPYGIKTLNNQNMIVTYKCVIFGLGGVHPPSILLLYCNITHSFKCQRLHINNPFSFGMGVLQNEYIILYHAIIPNFP